MAVTKTKDAAKPAASADTSKPWETMAGETLGDDSLPGGDDSLVGGESEPLLEEGSEVILKDDAIEEAKELILANAEKTESPAPVKEEEVPSDLVVAFSTKVFSISHPNGTKTHFIAGNNTVSRDDAEHWYSKAQGVQIIGVPDVASVKSPNSQEAYASLRVDLENLGKKIFALTELKDLTAEQSNALKNALSFAGQADEAIADFLETLN